jgi:hypothetical protein
LGYGLYLNNDTGNLRLKGFRRDRLRNRWPSELVRGDVWPWQGRWEDAGATEEPF